jgi:hypothetical protein
VPQKAKKIFAFVGLLLLLIIFTLSVIKSSKYQSPTAQPVSVAQLKQRLAKGGNSIASDLHNHSANLAASSSSSSSASNTNSAAQINKQANANKLNNTGPGNVVALFLVTSMFATGLHVFITSRAN